MTEMQTVNTHTETIADKYLISLFITFIVATLKKKISDFPVPSRNDTHQTHSPGIIKLFPAWESFVSDITDVKPFLCNGWEHYVPYRCL
jgi:hypothetical protein